MENYLLFFCAYFIEAIILWQYAFTTFHPKHSAFTRIALLASLYFLLSIFFALNLIGVNAIAFFAANFIFFYFMFYSGLFSALFHASLVTAIMGLSELIVTSAIPNMMYNYYEATNFKQTFIVHMILSKFLYFLLLFAISHFTTHRKEITQPNRKEILLILTIPLLSIWIAISIFMIYVDSLLPNHLCKMILISAFLLLIINIITWFIYTYTQRKNREFTTLQLQLQRELDAAAYYQMLLKQDESQQILIHDIKKHLQSLSILNEQGQQDKIHAYIQQIINSSDLQVAARLCDNEMLNAILGRYSRRCMEEQIDFHADIRSGVVDFIKDEDMTSLFCNLLDNALEAAATYPHSYIELSVHNRPNTPLTIISMINSCRINPFDKNGQLHSRKADPLRHGFGMKSVERMVAKYNGEMTMYYKDEDYTFHTIIMLRDKEKIKQKMLP